MTRLHDLTRCLSQGTADAVVPFTYADDVRRLIGAQNLTFRSIDGANHDITVTHPTKVNEFMLDFLSHDFSLLI